MKKSEKADSADSIDILMATYNGEKFLIDQLDSIMNQSHKNFHLIIADDHSTDSTQSILKSYAQKDNRIHLIFHEKNIGVIKNFEYLLSCSTASYFMFCDQDDIWHKDKVSDSLHKIKKTNSDLIYTDLQVVDENLILLNPSFWELEKIKPINKSIWKLSLSQNIITGCTIIARNSLKKNVLPFPKEIYMHDWWISFVASMIGKVDYINKPLVYYRQHENNTIGARRNESVEGMKGSFKRDYLKFIENRMLYYSRSIEVLSACYEKLSYTNPYLKSELDSISKVIDSHSYFRKIRFFSFRKVLYKLEFSSQGISRNLWWTLYNNAPLFAFIIKRSREKP